MLTTSISGNSVRLLSRSYFEKVVLIATLAVSAIGKQDVLIGKTWLSWLYIEPDTFVYCIKLPRLASGRGSRRRRWISRRGTIRRFYFYDPPFRLSTLLRTLSRLPSRSSVRWHVDIYKARPRHAGHVKFTALFLAIHRRAEKESFIYRSRASFLV